MANFAGFQRAMTGRGVPVLFREDRRFKTFRVEFHIARPHDDLAPGRHVLPSLLMQGTQRDPDRPSLVRRMESLYGLTASPASYKRGEAHPLRLALSGVSGEFLPGQPDQVRDGFELVGDVLARPRLDAGAFPADVFAMEKRETLDGIRALADDKGAWARLRAIAFACENEPMGVPDFGSLEAVEALDAAAPEAVRQDYLSRGLMHVVATGALPEFEGLVARCDELFDALPASSPEALPDVVRVAERPVRHLVEHAPGMEQAKFLMVFRLPPDQDRKRDVARSLFDLVYGGTPQSRLFREVREKHSLAYYAQSAVDRHKDVMVVHVGCDAANAQAVENECLAQLADLAAGRVDEQELRTAKAQMVSRLTRVDEGLGSSAHFVSEQWALGSDRSPEELIKVAEQTTVDEVVAEASSAWLDAVYLLAPEQAEGGNA